MGAAFTRNIVALREDRGLLQYELADAVGLRQATVSMWETKGTQPRSPKVIKLLCDFFGCDESDLFGYSDGYYAKTRGIRHETPDIGRSSSVGTPDSRSLLVPDYVVEASPNGFAFILPDDSMSRSIPRGSKLYVDRSSDTKSGDVVVLRRGDELLCRVMTAYDKVYVFDADTDSRNFRRLIIDRSDAPSDFEILGRVVWFEKEL